MLGRVPKLAYKHMTESWRTLWKERPQHFKDRLVEWRRGPTIVKLERPSRPDKARRLGYKAKQCFTVVRVRVRKGGMRRQRPRSGRRPKHLGVKKLTAAVSAREVAERRALKKHPNLKLVNSYYVGEDGKYVWYEVILVDPHHPTYPSLESVRKQKHKEE